MSRLRPVEALVLLCLAPVAWCGTEMMEIHQTSSRALVGKATLLKCDISSPDPTDRPRLVLWYKTHVGAPIYSFDSRDTEEVARGKHWSDDKYSSRAFFRTQDPSGLSLHNVMEEDAGVYRCRVDFGRLPTRITVVTLDVIVPPGKPEIRDGNGHTIDNISPPYNEGDDLLLSCHSYGGKPSSMLKWRSSNKVYQEESDIFIQSLQRSDYMSSYTCEASNSNLTSPIFTTIRINMNLQPLEATILGKNSPLSAGKEYEVICEVRGSKPEPIITWHLGNRTLKAIMRPEEQFLTRSTLMFIPSETDNGKVLSCTGVNPLITDSEVNDFRKLSVYYNPQVNLSLGISLDAKNIKEGDDVYFECSVRALPWIFRLEWLHEGALIHQNITGGIIISNLSLVLQKIQRKSSGAYICRAHNTEGAGESQPIELKVQHVPVCSQSQRVLYGVAKHEDIQVMCHVSGYPPPIKFYWSFNNSRELTEFPIDSYSQDGMVSVLNYKPVKDNDYGTLLCWSQNAIGKQDVPCALHIVPAGPPESLELCEVVNQTRDSLKIECKQGFDGGLVQSFLLEVFSVKNHVLYRNISSSTPTFLVDNLEKNVGLTLYLYAYNQKGRTDPYKLDVEPLKLAEWKTNTEEGSSRSILYSVIGVSIGFLVLLLLLVVLLFRRKRRRKAITDSLDKSNSLSNSDTDREKQSWKMISENNPDLVPDRMDTLEVPPPILEEIQVEENTFYNSLTNPSSIQMYYFGPYGSYAESPYRRHGQEWL